MYTIRQISLKGYFMFHSCTKKHKNDVLCISILVNTNFVRKQKERERDLSPMRILVSHVTLTVWSVRRMMVWTVWRH